MLPALAETRPLMGMGDATLGRDAQPIAIEALDLNARPRPRRGAPEGRAVYAATGHQSRRARRRRSKRGLDFSGRIIVKMWP